MGIFDALDGSAYSQANRRNQQTIATGLQQGGNALMTSGQNALGYLLGAPGQAGALQVTDRGYDQAGSALTGQYGQTQDILSQLGQLYQPETQMGQGALTRYLNATGANGAAGSAQAQQDFTAAPGYQYALNQSLGAVQRSAASRGGLAGGNATADILNTATGLANQGFQQYINNLKGGSDFYSQGIAGQAGALQGQASASQGYGNGLAALDTGRASALAGTLGSAAGVQTGLGTNLANLTNGATNSLGAGNNAEAKGRTEASSNALGALFGGASLLAGGAGGAGGLGNVFSSLGGGASANSLIGRAGSGLASLAGYSPIPRF